MNVAKHTPENRNIFESPAGIAVYYGSGWCHAYKELDGVRCYIRPNGEKVYLDLPSKIVERVQVSDLEKERAARGEVAK